jgi:hypothetical protein
MNFKLTHYWSLFSSSSIEPVTQRHEVMVAPMHTSEHQRSALTWISLFVDWLTFWYFCFNVAYYDLYWLADSHENYCKGDTNTDAKEDPVPPENLLPSPGGIVVEFETDTNKSNDEKNS